MSAKYDELRALGLSKAAIACYESLCRDGITHAGQLAQRLNKPRSTLYTALKKLERMGFVENLKVSASHTLFRPIRLDRALENLAIYQREAVAKVIQQQIEQSIQQRVRGRP